MKRKPKQESFRPYRHDPGIRVWGPLTARLSQTMLGRLGTRVGRLIVEENLGRHTVTLGAKGRHRRTVRVRVEVFQLDGVFCADVW